MDDFDLTKLRTDRERLSKILRAFVELKTSTGLMVSKDDLLKIFGSNDGRRYTGAPTLNYLTVCAEYIGDDDRSFFKPDEVLRLISANANNVIRIPSYAQPLGWEDEVMDKNIKDDDGVEVDIQQLKNALSFLLRPDFSKCHNSEYFGVIFRNHEMITTNGIIMLIQNGMPLVTATPRLLGYDAAVSLYSILRTPYVVSVRMGVAKKSGVFGIRIELDDGVEMFYWSRPKYLPIDDYKDPRPAVDPRSVGFVVHGAFLESLLEHTIKAVVGKEVPVVHMYMTQSGMGYTAYGADDQHVDPPRGIYQGELPMARSMGTDDVQICVNASVLLQAIKGLGESVQFIVPYHPLLGFQVQEIDPFYVNCNQAQFALLAQYVLDRERVLPLEKLKRKAQNAMENS